MTPQVLLGVAVGALVLAFGLYGVYLLGRVEAAEERLEQGRTPAPEDPAEDDREPW